jgi:hypothetical protein
LTPTKESAISWIEENQRLLWNAFHLSQKGGIKSVGCKNREYIIIQKALEEVKRYVTQNVSPRFVLENFFLKISNLYSQKH